jgi:hypothetical protein
MQMRTFIVFLFLLVLSIGASAQTDRILSRDSAWRSNGIFSLNIGQTSFTNWVAGGENQININNILHYRLRYNKDKSSWENMIEAKYGVLLFSNLKTKKTDDQLNFTSKYGYKASKKWNYSYYLSLNTQFANGYNYPNDSVIVSGFMAPGYIMAGLGMDFLPTKTISILISPITYKSTIVNNNALANAGNFGMEKAITDTAGNIIVPSNKFRNEPGAFLKIYYQQEFKKGLNLSSKAEFFVAFNDNPENIDVKWSTFISYKISKVFSATFSLDLIYDDDAVYKEDANGDGIKEVYGPRLQAKQTFGIGIGIKL